MKVLKHGNLYQTNGISTCKDCGCKFSYTTKDIHIEVINGSFTLLAGKLFRKYVICPECNEQKEIY